MKGDETTSEAIVKRQLEIARKRLKEEDLSAETIQFLNQRIRGYEEELSKYRQ